MAYADYVKADRENRNCRNNLCSDSHALIRKAIEYVNENYTEQLTREEVCKVAMMSKTAFANLFKQETGDSLVEYIHILRVRLAKQLLCESGLNITEIGERCGFDSTTYFGRVFKKKTGMTPREYRQRGNNRNDTVSESCGRVDKVYKEIKK